MDCLQVVTAGRCSCRICSYQQTTTDKITSYQDWIADTLTRTIDITRTYDLIEELQEKRKEEQLARLGEMDIIRLKQSVEFYQEQINIADDVLSQLLDDLTDNEVMEIDAYIQRRQKLIERLQNPKIKKTSWKVLELVTLGEEWEEVIFIHTKKPVNCA